MWLTHAHTWWSNAITISHNIILVISITTQSMRRVELYLPLWGETQSGQLVLQISQLGIELVLLSVEVTEHILLCISSIWILLLLLLCPIVSDALLITIGLGIERIISVVYGGLASGNTALTTHDWIVLVHKALVVFMVL